MKARRAMPRDRANGRIRVLGVRAMNIQRSSTVWVWDSFWLPAVVAQPALTGFVLVRFEHGVTSSVNISDLEPRDPAAHGTDTPAPRESRYEPRGEWSLQNPQSESFPTGEGPQDPWSELVKRLSLRRWT
jgi:hypothetical protein